LFDDFAIMMIAMWPAIPLFLIQLHGATSFWKKIGVWMYVVVFLEWLPIGYVINLHREFLLQFQLEFSIFIVIIGFSFIGAGIVLHSWTAYLLGIKATIGYTELEKNPKPTDEKLIDSGPFSVVRHPSYWAHTFILFGTFLISGSIIVGVITLIDLLIAYFVTMELEDRELVERFEDQYEDYKKRVPKFFPKVK
jgi:protein-S-isoprenylcysteine O-methyltransferase Ste14